MFSKIVKFINEEGIPVPLLRDPKTKRGDVSYTNLVLSILVMVAVLAAPLFGMSKESLDSVGALGYLTISAGLYWQRKKTVQKIVDNVSKES